MGACRLPRGAVFQLEQAQVAKEAASHVRPQICRATEVSVIVVKLAMPRLPKVIDKPQVERRAAFPPAIAGPARDLQCLLVAFSCLPELPDMIEGHTQPIECSAKQSRRRDARPLARLLRTVASLRRRSPRRRSAQPGSTGHGLFQRQSLGLCARNGELSCIHERASGRPIQADGAHGWPRDTRSAAKGLSSREPVPQLGGHADRSAPSRIRQALSDRKRRCPRSPRAMTPPAPPS